MSCTFAEHEMVFLILGRSVLLSLDNLGFLSAQAWLVHGLGMILLDFCAAGGCASQLGVLALGLMAAWLGKWALKTSEGELSPTGNQFCCADGELSPDKE